MVKTLGLVVFAFALLGAASPADRSVVAPEATDRRVNGVITSLDPSDFRISNEQRAVAGRIDPLRTKVRINGQAAKLADLKLSGHAKGELCLDDTWVLIDAR